MQTINKLNIEQIINWVIVGTMIAVLITVGMAMEGNTWARVIWGLK